MTSESGTWIWESMYNSHSYLSKNYNLFFETEKKSKIPGSETAMKVCWVSRVKLMEWAWSQGHYHTFLNYPVQMFKFMESQIHWGLELVTSSTCHEEFLSSLPTGKVYCSCSSQTWAWPHSDLPTSLILIKLPRTQGTYSTSLPLF